MSRLLFLGFVTAGALLASVADAQPPASPGSLHDPSPDSQLPYAVQRGESADAARRVMRIYAGCVARARRRWAEAALALPLFDTGQTDYVVQGIGREDACMGDSGLRLRFQAPALIGGMAEELIATRFSSARTDPISALTDADLERTGLAPRNGNELFALCVVRRAPALVRDFVLTQPLSAQERAAARQLAPNLGPCLDQGQSLPFAVPTLRALLAPVLYRSFATLAPSQGRD
jgi:hypothetical protein